MHSVLSKQWNCCLEMAVKLAVWLDSILVRQTPWSFLMAETCSDRPLQAYWHEMAAGEDWDFTEHLPGVAATGRSARVSKGKKSQCYSWLCNALLHRQAGKAHMSSGAEQGQWEPSLGNAVSAISSAWNEGCRRVWGSSSAGIGNCVFWRSSTEQLYTV